MTTMKDVANLAGVHPTVVSRVLNNDTSLNIRKETRDRILKAVKDLNYVPNRSAQNLKKNETKMLGLIIPDFSNPVYAEIIHGAEDQATIEGYSLIVSSTRQKNGKKESLSHMLEGRIDGLMVAISDVEDDEIFEMKKDKIPFLLINRFVDGVDNYVILDDQSAGELATNHLIELGHKRITHISGPMDTSTGKERAKGFEEAVKKANIKEYHIEPAAYSLEEGHIAMKKILETDTPPTAIFAGSILIALGAMRAVREKGLEIPKDISIISLHDVPFAGVLHPPLTTVKMPLYEMGQEAVKGIVSVIKDKKKTELKINGGELIERVSTKKPSK